MLLVLMKCKYSAEAAEAMEKWGGTRYIDPKNSFIMMNVEASVSKNHNIYNYFVNMTSQGLCSGTSLSLTLLDHAVIARGPLLRGYACFVSHCDYTKSKH